MGAATPSSCHGASPGLARDAQALGSLWAGKVQSLASPASAQCSVPHTCGMALPLPLPGVHPRAAWHVLSETEERMEEQGEVRGGEVEKFSSLEDYSKAKKWKAKIPHWETPWRISENEAE